MLTTDELKEHVERIVSEKIQPHFEEKFEVDDYFQVVTTGGREGAYVFVQDNMYHYAGMERGRILGRRTTTSLDEITYWVLGDTIFPVASRYAAKCRKEGENFRRAMFRYELEAFGYAGEAYLAMQQARIDWALEQAPYSDE